jgi:hypothetical protein
MLTQVAPNLGPIVRIVVTSAPGKHVDHTLLTCIGNNLIVLGDGHRP